MGININNVLVMVFNSFRVKPFLILFFILISFSSKADLELTFSHSRGYYNNSFSLIIEADDPTAIIRYTTNGKTPTLAEGSTYNSAININSTTVVKAYAYSATETSMVEGHSFIYINDVLNQPDATPNFPYATGFSSTIKNDAALWSQMSAALLALPAMSLTLNLVDYNYIYNNKGISRQAHIEYFEPNSSETYDRPAGVSTYGNTTFNSPNSNKRNYRLKFKEEFGASKFKYKIFGDEAVNEFDGIDLRAGGQETMDRGGVQNIHEQILKDWQNQMSGFAVHGKFTHLYVNGVYWGVYTVCERPENSFGESYFGGDKDDYNTVKATCCDSTALAIDGTINSYDNMIAQLPNYPNIEQYLDVSHYIDWFILCNYGPHGDWTPWNTYAFDNPTANVPFRFFMWDPEPSFNNDWYYTNWIGDTRFFKAVWNPLKVNEDFRMRFADHAQCNCVEADGTLNPSNAETYYDMVFQQNKLPYLAEAARWADKSLYVEFLNYRDDLINSGWFFNRADTLIETYINTDLYSTLDAVTFSQYGGTIANGTSISLSNPNGGGSIYYTIDRTDARALGGGISGTAQTYNGSISLPTGVHEIKARVKQNNDWSAMCPRKFYVGQNYSGLVINEIHYNPSDSIYFNLSINAMDTISGKNFEFVELKNTSSQNIYLEDLHFNKGITIKFEYNTIIPPNGFIVIAEDAYWFQQKYGFAPDAEYRGKLDNGGENLTLSDPVNNIINSLTYDDAAPWDDIPDNGIYSLALIDASLNNNDPSNWSAQVVKVTPKSENLFCTPIASNEFIIPIDCGGAATGSIVVNPSGGTSPYSYQWSNGITVPAVTGLSGGNYQLTITDSFGCEQDETFTITEPNALQLSEVHVDESLAGENDGVINLAVNGGTAPYNYSWSNGATNQDINNLADDTYTVQVTDANNCTESLSITIQPGVAVCSVPNNITASNIQNTSVTLAWNNDPNSNNYEIQYRQLGFNSWTTFNSNYAFAIMNNLNSCTDYEVRILSNCSSGQVSSYSNIYSFTTAGCAALCTTVQGLFSQNVTSSSAFLVWDIVPNASYTLYYRQIGDNTWLTYSTAFSIAIFFSLPACTDFEWYVEVNCPDGNISNPSPTNYFTTTGAACKTNTLNNLTENHFVIYPNPVIDVLYISIPNNTAEGRLEITNYAGQSMLNKFIPNNSNLIAVNVSHLPQGSYIVKFNAQKGSFVKY